MPEIHPPPSAQARTIIVRGIQSIFRASISGGGKRAGWAGPRWDRAPASEFIFSGRKSGNSIIFGYLPEFIQSEVDAPSVPWPYWAERKLDPAARTGETTSCPLTPISVKIAVISTMLFSP